MLDLTGDKSLTEITMNQTAKPSTQSVGGVFIITARAKLKKVILCSVTV